MSGYPIGATCAALPEGDRFARILVTNNGESYAIVIDGTRPFLGLTGICSAWPDGQWLGTMHPIGPSVDRPNLKLRFADTTIENAISEHRDAIARMKQAHGLPRRIGRMADREQGNAPFGRANGASEKCTRSTRTIGLDSVGRSFGERRSDSCCRQSSLAP